MSEIELKVCPFCGGDAERIEFGPGSGDNEGGSCVACTECGSSGPVEFGYKEKFVSMWNRRVPQWQPIESAPKDLSTFLAGEFYFADGECTYKEFSTAYRHQDGQVHCYDENVTVTHWRPLPAPPEAE